MRCFSIALLAVAIAGVATAADDDSYAKEGHKGHSRTLRAAPTASPADVMAQNILEWIQGIYHQGVRKTRQQSENNAYLPPYSTQRPPEKPRPFRPATPSQQPSYSSPAGNEISGYPQQSSPSSFYTPSNRPSSFGSSTTRQSYIPPGNNQGGASSFASSQGSGTTYKPRPTIQYPGGSIGASIGASIGGSQGSASFGISSSFGGGSSTTYLPPQNRPSIPSVTPPKPTPGYPSEPRPSPGFPSPQTTGNVGYPSPQPSPLPSFPPTGTGNEGYPSQQPGPSPTFPSPQPQPGPTSPPYPSGPSGPDTGVSGGNEISTSVTQPGDDDLKHPPHIHNIDVQCSKTMMTINIEFNRAFDGVIYSKGFFMNPACRYVEQNSGKTDYSFTVNLDSCGTQFINDFEGEAGQAYLENVLVLQNEPGIQEVWDTVRRVRCLWEGNINKALTVSLSVDMLNQEIVTFSGDTATAKLDIQIGKGPFAPAANGLVKIGETMTLVVSVEGDPAFDLQVRDCIARDETSTNVVQLTDERGCILKPKLFGAFQKTRDTGNTGASIIAYAFFQAFKFPDVMDLFIECNVELCKTDCEPCPEANQQIDPGRRRRDVSYVSSNTTGVISDPVRVARGFRVVMLEDLSRASNEVLEKMEETAIEQLNVDRNVCMSNTGFYATFALLLSILSITSISTALLFIKMQKIHRLKTASH